MIKGLLSGRKIDIVLTTSYDTTPLVMVESVTTHNDVAYSGLICTFLDINGAKVTGLLINLLKKGSNKNSIYAAMSALGGRLASEEDTHLLINEADLSWFMPIIYTLTETGIYSTAHKKIFPSIGKSMATHALYILEGRATE